MVIRYMYSLFLGALLAVFIGVGIAAFYMAPKSPEYPIMTAPIHPDGAQSTEDIKEQRAYEVQSRDFQKENEQYSKNVSIIAIAAAVLLVVISLLFIEKILILSDGILLGGIFTLVYAIMRGFGNSDEMFRFFVVSVGLLVALFVGYWKFVRGIKKK